MPHVLIVDDDDNSAEMLATLVAGEGFTTAIAGSLREAKQQLLMQSPQVILLDLQLPDGSGLDLVTELRVRGVVLEGYSPFKRTDMAEPVPKFQVTKEFW